MKKENKIYLFLGLILIIAIIVIVFVFQNNENITVSFFSFEFNSTIAMVIVISFFMGTIFSIIFMAPHLIKSRKTIKNLNKKVVNAKIETGMDSLKNEKDENGEDKQVEVEDGS